MKKKVILLLAATMLVGSLAGCGTNGASSNEITKDVANAEMLANADKSSLVNATDAVKAFDDALTKSKGCDNITISSSTSTNIGEGDKAEKALNTAELKKNTKDSTTTASCKMSNDYNGEKSDVSGYYDGKTLYFISTTGKESSKIKEDMSYDDFASVVDSYSLSLYEEDIAKASLETKKDGSKVYKIAYDPAKLQATMQTNIEASGQSMPDGQSMNVNFSNVEANIDKDGYITSFAFYIDAKYVGTDGEKPYNYSITATFTDKDKTKVDEVTKTDDYMTAEEYQQKMAAEQSTEGASGAGSEATTIALESAPEVTTVNQPDPNAK